MPAFVDLEARSPIAGCRVIGRIASGNDHHPGAKWRCVLACGHRDTALGATLLKYEREGKQYVCRACAIEVRKHSQRARINPNRTEADRERDRERAKRARETRASVESLARMPKHERAARAEFEALQERVMPVRRLIEGRPKTRGECAGRARPCPYVGCQFHLYLDVERNGNLRMNFPDVEPWEIPETCALDVADRGGDTLENVGELMNITRERIRQVENVILTKLSKDRVLESIRYGIGT